MRPNAAADNDVALLITNKHAAEQRILLRLTGQRVRALPQSEGESSYNDYVMNGIICCS